MPDTLPSPLSQPPARSLAWVDTHCHLDAAEFDADRDWQVQVAAQRGVAALVLPAVEPANFEAVRCLAHRCDGASTGRAAYPVAAYALGIHPIYVDRVVPADMQTLQQALTKYRDDPKLVAVGEIGMDLFVPGLDTAWMLHVFQQQLRLARELDLPVILHVRRALDPILRELRRFKPAGGIAHAFNGSEQQAEQFIKLGFKLGFGGVATFERSRQIRRLLTSQPRDAIVLETDAPDLAPSWIYPGRNSPAELPHIGAKLAEYLGIEAAELAATTRANALQALPKLRALMHSVSGG